MDHIISVMAHKHFCSPQFYSRNRASAALAEAKGASCPEVWFWWQHTPETCGGTCRWHHASPTEGRGRMSLVSWISASDKFIITLLRINLDLLHVLPPQFERSHEKLQKLVNICEMSQNMLTDVYISMYVLGMFSKKEEVLFV